VGFRPDGCGCWRIFSPEDHTRTWPVKMGPGMGFIYHPWVTHQTLENSPRSISAQHITELCEANNQYTLSNPSSPSPSPISQTRTHNHNPSGGSLLHYPVQTRERETGDGRSTDRHTPTPVRRLTPYFGSGTFSHRQIGVSRALL
jgi:hypothetical protein